MAIVVGVDCRLIAESGIGTSLRGFLQPLITSRPEWKFVLLGDPLMLRELHWCHRPNVAIELFNASVYPVIDHWRWWRLRKFKLDLLWVPHFTIPLLSLVWRGRLLVTVHDITLVAIPEVSGAAKYLYAYIFYKLIRFRADAVFFVSRFSQREFSARIGVPRGLNRVIYNGVAQEWFEAGRNVTTVRKSGEQFIVYVGNVKPHKNLRRLISAFGSLINRIPHKLVIIGRNRGFRIGEEGIEDFAKPLGDRIRFAGAVDGAVLRSSVAQASFLVLPSLYEGFGLPALEAMAAGCPVVAARIPSLMEICGDAAAYFDPLDEDEIAESMLRMLEDEQLRQHHIVKGLDRALQFDWDASAKTLSLLMVELLHDGAA
ncbi:MAG: glycosyltransferase family 1 protein [Betaproteobacteria bacterium]